jgi:anti-anti-sigma regulatory factor
MLERSEKDYSNVSFSIDNEGRSGFVKISGILTGRKADAIKKTVENSANTVEYFKLNLENVTAVDVSCIEALYSTCSTMRKSNKPMHIDGICPIAFTSAVEDVGYSHHKWLCFGQ